jgi:predicted transcriptional regulator
MAMRKLSAELIAKLYDRGYSVCDIAKITGVSENGVAKRILERPECQQD